MNLNEFLQTLAAHPGESLRFELPGGQAIPAHFHITEVGHVVRRFVDCGGTRRSTESCLLQAWVAEDTAHRLGTDKLLRIFAHADGVLPHRSLPVEIEYEDGRVSQYPVLSSEPRDGALVFTLGLRHTDCLAKEKCLPSGCGITFEPLPANNCCGSSSSSCCR